MPTKYYSDWREVEHTCGKCGWKGTGAQAAQDMYYGGIQVDCPECDARLLLVALPSEKSVREAAAKGNPEAIAELATLDKRAVMVAAIEASQITDASELPDLEGDTLDFYLTSRSADEAPMRLDLKTERTQESDPVVVHSELSFYETIEPVERLVPLLEERYGSRFRYLRIEEFTARDLYYEASYLRGFCHEALGEHLAPGQL